MPHGVPCVTHAAVFVTGCSKPQRRRRTHGWAGACAISAWLVSTQAERTVFMHCTVYTYSRHTEQHRLRVQSTCTVGTQSSHGRHRGTQRATAWADVRVHGWHRGAQSTSLNVIEPRDCSSVLSLWTSTLTCTAPTSLVSFLVLTRRS